MRMTASWDDQRVPTIDAGDDLPRHRVERHQWEGARQRAVLRRSVGVELLHQRCVELPGTHHRNGDSLGLQLKTERLAESVDGVLGRTVGGLAEHTEEAGHRADVDDAATRRLEVRQAEPGDVEHSVEVDVHHGLEVTALQLLEIALTHDAGRVDDDVDALARRGEVLDRVVGGIEVTDVHRVEAYPRPRSDAGDVIACLVEAIAITCQQGDVEPAVRERGGQRQPQTRRTAGDHGVLPLAKRGAIRHI